MRWGWASQFQHFLLGCSVLFLWLRRELQRYFRWSDSSLHHRCNCIHNHPNLLWQNSLSIYDQKNRLCFSSGFFLLKTLLRGHTSYFWSYLPSCQVFYWKTGWKKLKNIPDRRIGSHHFGTCPPFYCLRCDSYSHAYFPYGLHVVPHSSSRPCWYLSQG